MVLKILLLAFVSFINALPTETGFDLHLVHINDFHARFEETSRYGGICKRDCIGGFSRLYTAVHNEIKRRPNSIVINAGDNFQGTLWYNIYKWNVTQHFLNKIPTDVYTLGNHDFDDGIKGLVPFIKALNSPVVVVNIDDSEEPDIQGTYNKSVVITRDGKRIGVIGVIGLVISTTNLLSSTGRLKFLDESQYVNQEAERLVKDENVDTVIVVSHSGYEVEKKIAEKASPKIGVVIGAHSHTFLYSGSNPPGIEQPEGPYPTVIKQENGRQVLVVQASAYSRYLGNITINYNNDGEVTGWSGEPIYLDTKISQDLKINEEILKWKHGVDEYGNKAIGESQVLLNQTGCYQNECNIGNLITDAMISAYTNNNEEGAWAYASIAVINPGDIRTSIEKGNISYSDLANVQPFENSVDVGEIQGKYLKETFEHSVNVYNNEKIRENLLLQVSGVKMVYNMTNPIGSRVQSLKLLCRKCSVPIYEDYNPEEFYRVVAISYLADGGDGFEPFSKNLINRIHGQRDVDILEQYLRNNSPINKDIEGRIQIIY